MWQLADGFAEMPDTVEISRDAWFERHIHVLVAGLRASLEGRITLPGVA